MGMSICRLPLPMPPTYDGRRLRATLGAPGLDRVLAALRRRLELGKPLTGRLTLSRATAAERTACDDLVGRSPSSGETLSLDLDALGLRLWEAGVCADLASAVAELTGPVTDRRAAANTRERAWAGVWAAARGAQSSHPELAGWLDQLRDSGLVRRLSRDDPLRASNLLSEVFLALAALPVRGEPLPSFAARVLDDAHALDAGKPRATLTVRAAARLGRIEFEDNAEGRRAAWASVGVLCDELSNPVLALNLPAAGDSPLARLLNVGAGAGEPVHLSLRLLLRHPLGGDTALAERDVFVCENPTVVALAASHLGRRCAPLVCINGQPATPALVLLRQLRTAGARLHYHGDFDPGGLVIARRLFSDFGVTSWRYAAADYADAPKGKPFAADPGATPWSPGLAEAMRGAQRAVHEEALFDVLAADLADTRI
jgi:uncharacterized protein (TIGR02679 family)